MGDEVLYGRDCVSPPPKTVRSSWCAAIWRLGFHATGMRSACVFPFRASVTHGPLLYEAQAGGSHVLLGRDLRAKLANPYRDSAMALQ